LIKVYDFGPVRFGFGNHGWGWPGNIGRGGALFSLFNTYPRARVAKTLFIYLVTKFYGVVLGYVHTSLDRWSTTSNSQPIHNPKTGHRHIQLDKHQPAESTNISPRLLGWARRFPLDARIASIIPINLSSLWSRCLHSSPLYISLL